MASRAGGARELARALGRSFRKLSLLEQALTHRSYAARTRPRATSYERLEFLGDRVLGLVVADLLLTRFPDEEEGEIARRFASLVRREALAFVAGRIGLARYLRLEKGEERTGGRDNPAILADALEAVIAALYLDGGLDAAAAFVGREWAQLIGEQEAPPKDMKTALQEWALGEGKPLPSYRMVKREGPDHAPVITVEVRVEGLPAAEGRGPSRRAAEQAAAAALLAKASRRRDG